VLKADGILAVLYGQTHLFDAGAMLAGFRPYRWTACYLTEGPGYVSHSAKVQSNWKPVFIYGGTERFGDQDSAVEHRVELPGQPVGVAVERGRGDDDDHHAGDARIVVRRQCGGSALSHDETQLDALGEGAGSRFAVRVPQGHPAAIAHPASPRRGRVGGIPGTSPAVFVM
jgi:hypothetical protein